VALAGVDARLEAAKSQGREQAQLEFKQTERELVRVQTSVDMLSAELCEKDFALEEATTTILQLTQQLTDAQSRPKAVDNSDELKALRTFISEYQARAESKVSSDIC
jgi:hypothetical protein